MSKRYAIIIGVFVLGFAAGYGLTWIVVSGPGPSPDAEATAIQGAGGPADEARVPGGQDDAPPSGVVARGADGASEAGVAPDVVVATDAAEPGGQAGEGAPVAPEDGGDEGDSVGDEVGDADHAADDGEAADPDDDGDDAEGAAAAAADQPWWEACLDEVCVVDFGRLRGGLSVREGTLTHRETVDWETRFSDAPRAGVLPVESGLEVELHGVGVQHGVPVAAQITWRGGDGPLSGVIALSIGDKHVALTPPSD